VRTVTFQVTLHENGVLCGRPGGIPLVLTNAWICFRISSTSLSNNPSLQNHSAAKIEESTTRHANRQVEFSPLPWCDKTYLLQTVFSYHGMKRIITFCPSFLFCYQCIAGKTNPMGVCFPHTLSVLHHNSMETGWFSLTMHDSPLTEEKFMQSSSDTRVSMLLLSILRRSAYSKKYSNTLKLNLERLRLLLLDVFWLV
jgi:hypothetical protein